MTRKVLASIESPDGSDCVDVFDAGITIRDADGADALRLHALATQVFLDTYAATGIREAVAREVSAELSQAVFAARLGSPGYRAFLAERDRHLVAFAEVESGRSHALLGTVAAAELTRLYVQSPFVRRRVGSALLQVAEAHALASGASVLWLTAWVGNARALAFYASRGYEERGVTFHEFENERFENRLFARSLRPGG